LLFGWEINLVVQTNKRKQILQFSANTTSGRTDKHAKRRERLAGNCHRISNKHAKGSRWKLIFKVLAVRSVAVACLLLLLLLLLVVDYRHKYMRELGTKLKWILETTNTHTHNSHNSHTCEWPHTAIGES